MLLYNRPECTSSDSTSLPFPLPYFPAFSRPSARGTEYSNGSLDLQGGSKDLFDGFEDPKSVRLLTNAPRHIKLQ